MSQSQLGPAEVHYPETDGKPMAETDLHRDLMIELITSVQDRFRDVPDVYVSGNLLLYYVKDDATKSVAPDFFVVRGVEKRRRRIYKVWEEGKGPDLVVEITSRSTHREDLTEKLAIYDALGVAEYFIFDPEGIGFRPELQGYRRRGASLQRVAAEESEAGALVLRSEVLGLELHGRGESLRWVDPSSGKALPLRGELRAEAEAEARRAEAEARRADAEKARADALAEELARLRRGR